MPHEQMDEQQAAAYLQMDLRDVRRLASRGRLPARRSGEKFIFRKSEIDHWVETRMSELDQDQLADIEKGVSAHHGFDDEAMLVTPMIPDGGIAVPLEARTRGSVIRSLVALADAAELVWAPNDLIDNIDEREELCSTAIAPGVAIPHPRHPLPWDIAASFITVGLTSAGIPFAAPDGSLTRLFFCVCCKDEKSHLHVLARLGQMLHETGAIDDLLAAGTPDELRQHIAAHERAAIQ